MCEQCADLNEGQANEAKKPEIKERELRGRGLGVVIHLAERTLPVPVDKTKTGTLK